MKYEKLIDYSIDFFEEFIKAFDYINLNDDIKNLEHNLNILKNKAIRSRDFIKHYKEHLDEKV